VIVTSDNPRNESPAAILAEVAAGITQRETSQLIEDRREAIASCVAAADASDVILIAGKGHEDYQEVAGVRHPFSDVVEAESALAKRAVA